LIAKQRKDAVTDGKISRESKGEKHKQGNKKRTLANTPHPKTLKPLKTLMAPLTGTKLDRSSRIFLN
jgi:hypothetical protein